MSKTEGSKTTGSKTTENKTTDNKKSANNKNAKTEVVATHVCEEEDQRTDDVEALPKAARSARNALGRNGYKITNLLLDKAVNGDCSSIRLLMKLAEPGKQISRKKSGPSPTVALAKEPPWDGGRKKNEEVALAATA